MRKICFVMPNAYSLFLDENRHLFGGAEVRSFLFAKELCKRRGYQVSFILANHGQKREIFKDGIKLYADGYFDYRQIKRGLISKFLRKLKLYFNSNLRSYYKLDSQRAEKEKFDVHKKINADIYCTFIVSEFAGELVAFTKKYNKKSILFLAHDQDVSEEYLTEGVNSWGQDTMLGKYALMSADLIVSQNKYQYDSLKSRFKRDSILIKNPIDFNFQLEPLPRGFDVLWVGKSNLIKRPYLLLDIAEKCPELRFVMIMNLSIQEVHHNVFLNCPKNVEVIEYVPYEEIEKYFSSTQVFLSTSESEGFPNTFLQSGKYGLPIFSLSVNPDNFISKYDCGFFANNEPELLIEKLKITLRDNSLYNKYSRNCHQYFQQNHGLDVKVNELRAAIRGLYQEVTNA